MISLSKAKSSLSRAASHFVQNKKWWLGALLFGALVVRLLAIFHLHTYEFSSQREMGYEMGILAQSLANGEGFKFPESPHLSVWMAPLYPFLLSLVFRSFGNYTLSSAIAALIIQSIASALIVVPLYFVGKRLFNESVGLISAFMWILHPGAINYAVRRIWSSSFEALGLVLIILLLLRLRDRPRHPLDGFLCGLVIALTALANPVILAFVPFALLWLFWSSGKDKSVAIRQIGLIIILIIIVLSPWTVRNYIAFHRFIPIKGTFGLNLWQGNNPYVVQVGAGSRPLDPLPKEEAAYLSSLNEVDQSDILCNKAIDFIITHPAKFFEYTCKRVYLFWTIDFQDVAFGGGTVLLILLAAFRLLKVLLLLGILFSWAHWRETSLLLLLFVAFPVPYYITIMDTYRYRFPLEPLFLVFVAVSIWSLFYISQELLQKRKELSPA